MPLSVFGSAYPALVTPLSWDPRTGPLDRKFCDPAFRRVCPFQLTASLDNIPLESRQ